MTNPPPVHMPSPRQLWIKQRCIAVETRFNRRIGRAAFAARFLPLGLLLAAAYGNGHQAAPLLAPWIVFPLVAVTFYLTLLVLSQRFHDIGQSGANLLQIILPGFIWLWVGTNLMEKLPPSIWVTTAALLAVWPVIVLLHLFFRPGAPPPP